MILTLLLTHPVGQSMARILLIDDDADVRALAQQELEAAGHEVRTARHGAEGLALQRAAPADVVVTDIFMPEKEGVETIRELREEFPRIKIIAISGGGGRLHTSQRAFSTRNLDTVGRHLGVIAVLHKPFDAGELLGSVESALRDSDT